MTYYDRIIRDEYARRARENARLLQEHAELKHSFDLLARRYEEIYNAYVDLCQRVGETPEPLTLTKEEEMRR